MTKHIHGGDIYRYPDMLDFSANCNPYGMPEGVKKAVINAVDRAEHYPDVYCTALKNALSQAEKVPKEQIICGNGAADLIFSLVLAKKPKKALLAAPTFGEYRQALESVGCEVQQVFLKEETGFAYDEEFLAQITEELDMVFFCNPNNPTGVLAKRGYLKRLAEKCQACSAFLVVDECFNDFLEKPEDVTIKPHLTDFPGLFLLKAFTKKYAMPGLRLGYGLCSDRQMLEEMSAVMQPWSVSTLAQEAGIAALKETEYVSQTLQNIRKERAVLLEGIKNLGMKVYSSKANYIFFRGPKRLTEKCLEQGIMIRDCSNYAGLSEGFYRIAVRKRDENEKLLQVLQKIIEMESGERLWQKQS